MANPFQLDSDEQLIFEAKRHWINLVPIWVSAVTLVVVGVVLAFLTGRFPDSVRSYIPAVVPAIIVVILVVIGAAIVVAGLWVYHQNRLVLTNKHLIKVEQNGLFARKVSQLSLSRVQDVNGSHRGILATVFRYGTVEVQSAGEDEEFIFTQMPQQAEIADQLMKAHDEFGGQPDGLN
jgi:L-asparagine transporter-like permease